MKGNPYSLPPAKVLADMLAVHAWDDAIEDETRLLLEWAATTIRKQHKQNVRLAKTLEVTEARNAND
jgi:hypothetical protein